MTMKKLLEIEGYYFSLRYLIMFRRTHAFPKSVKKEVILLDDIDEDILIRSEPLTSTDGLISKVINFKLNNI